MRRLLSVLAALALLWGAAGLARADLVVNGGFETGDFTGWTLGGNLDGNTFVGNSPSPPHTGSFAAELGAVGSDNTMSQVLITVPGQSYDFSFWYFRIGGFQSDIHAFWNGVDVFDEVNSQPHPYQNHTFTVVATGALTTIEFDTRNDPTYDGLDDVSVNASTAAAPEIDPGSMSSALTLLVGSVALLRGRSRRRK